MTISLSIIIKVIIKLKAYNSSSSIAVDLRKSTARPWKAYSNLVYKWLEQLVYFIYVKYDNIFCTIMHKFIVLIGNVK